jgi:hypothetical protein
MLEHQELIEGKKVVFRLTTDKIRDIKIIAAKKKLLLTICLWRILIVFWISIVRYCSKKKGADSVPNCDEGKCQFNYGF